MNDLLSYWTVKGSRVLIVLNDNGKIITMFRWKSARTCHIRNEFEIMIKQDCIPVGCVPPARWPYLPACYTGGGVSAPGGCLLHGGCLLRGECLLRGDVCSRGVSALGGCLLQGCLLWGMSAPGGSTCFPLGWGVSALGGVCSWEGGLLPGGSAPGGCLLLWGGCLFQGGLLLGGGGCLLPGGMSAPRGVSVPGGVSALERVSAPGGVCLLQGGVCSWGGESQHALRQTPPC